MDVLEDKKSSNHNGATPVPRPVPERIDKSLQGQRPTTPRPEPVPIPPHKRANDE
jgi:hypothetical protein